MSLSWISLEPVVSLRFTEIDKVTVVLQSGFSYFQIGFNRIYKFLLGFPNRFEIFFYEGGGGVRDDAVVGRGSVQGMRRAVARASRECSSRRRSACERAD